MSEPEISQTPEGRPPEAPAAGSPPGPRQPAPRRARRASRKPGSATPGPPRPRHRPRHSAPPAPVVPLVRPDATAPTEADRRGRARQGPARPRPRGATTPRAQARAAAGAARGGTDGSKQVGRYLVCVHVQPHITQIAMLEGRSLVEHYVSRAADDTTQIDGNVYRGRVQNVLPGMEAAFIDIGIPKNAVLYRGDVRYDRDDIEGGASPAAPDRGRAQGRADDPVPGHQEPDRGQGGPADPGGLAARALRRPRAQLERLRHLQAPGRQRAPAPAPHHRRGEAGRPRPDRAHGGRGGLGRRAPARRQTLLEQWKAIEAEAKKSDQPGLLYREPDLAVRILREELNTEYRGVVIDDRALFEQVRDYVRAVSPELAERVEYYDTEVEGLPDLRALPRARAAPQGARPQGLAALGRLAHHRAHRGADGDRRQHRQERRQDQPRGDRLPQQPRGGRGGGPPAPAARHRRHHRHRLHRHGDPREPGQGGGGPAQRPGPGQDPDPGLRHLRAGPGRDDPQADLRGPDRVALDRVRGLRGPGRDPRRFRPALCARISPLCMP